MMKSCLLLLNLFADLLRFLNFSLQSKSSLAAENLFLRKQLAFYQERRTKPRRTSHSTRLTLVAPQNLIRADSLVVFERLVIAFLHGDGDKRSSPGRPKPNPEPAPHWCWNRSRSTIKLPCWSAAELVVLLPA